MVGWCFFQSLIKAGRSLALAISTSAPPAVINAITNALGVKEGGSGVPLDAHAYRRSVEFWSANANWR